MELQHVNIKVFVDGALQIDLQRIIEAFHRWTSAQSMDELLVDVADYRHVPAGPKVVLVGLEADYVLDHSGGRYGLLYNRKAAFEGSNVDRFRQALSAAVHACELLEAEFASQLMFDRREFELLVNDRSLAPNSAETFEACRAEIQQFLGELGHSNAQLTHHEDARRRFSVLIKLEQPVEVSGGSTAS